MQICAEKNLRHIALLLSLMFTGVHVNGGSADSFPPRAVTDAAESKRRTPLMGILSTVNGKPILVNGIRVPSGTTITSGVRLHTPDAIGAAILIEGVGRVDVAPQTRFLLSFDADSIEVDLKKGCLILTTYTGVGGTVMTPGGGVERTGPERRAFVDVCTDENAEGGAIVNRGAANRAGAGICWAVRAPVTDPSSFNPFFYALGAAPVLSAGVLYARDRGRRPEPVSPSTP